MHVWFAKHFINTWSQEQWEQLYAAVTNCLWFRASKHIDKRATDRPKMMDSDHNLAFLPCQNGTDDKVNTHVKPHLAHSDIEEPFYLIFCNLASVSQFPTHLVTETWSNLHAQAFLKRFSCRWASAFDGKCWSKDLSVLHSQKDVDFPIWWTINFKTRDVNMELVLQFSRCWNMVAECHCLVLQLKYILTRITF